MKNNIYKLIKLIFSLLNPFKSIFLNSFQKENLEKYV